MASYTPLYSPGDAISVTASVAVTGGQIVEITGSGTVGPAAANSVKVLGVAAFDAAANARVTVHVGKHIQEVTASGAIAAGDLVAAGANGTISTNAVPAAGVQAGVALTSAASGAKAQYVTR